MQHGLHCNRATSVMCLREADHRRAAAELPIGRGRPMSGATGNFVSRIEVNRELPKARHLEVDYLRV
jgi:hypothetical protein